MYIYLSPWLPQVAAAHKTFDLCCSMQGLSWSMWDLVP